MPNLFEAVTKHPTVNAFRCVEEDVTIRENGSTSRSQVTSLRAPTSTLSGSALGRA